MAEEIQLQFQVECDLTKPGEELYIIGNSKELGEWNKQDIKESQKLNCISFPLWQSPPISFKNKTSLEYKFIIKDPSNNDENCIKWENSFQGNRILDLSNLDCCLYLIDDGIFNQKSDPKITKLHEFNNSINHNINNTVINKNVIQNNLINNNIINNNFTDINYKKNNFSKKGLANIGATCYMNSTLQCFCHIKKFVKYFKYNPQIRNDKRKYTLAYSFKKLIDELYPENYNNKSYFSPDEFKEKISKMNPLFAGIAANDAKDLVNFIFLQLHEELNKARNNIINTNTFIDQRNNFLIRSHFFQNFKANNNSIISDLFYAMNNTITTCGKCNVQLYNYQVYFFLVFPLEEVRKFVYQNNQNTFINNNRFNNNTVTIFDCFNYDTKINQMTGANSMYCNYCKINTNSTTKTNLVTGPEILILLLNRGKGLEFDVKILFEEYLNLYHYIEFKNNGFKYKLFGVITHIGENGMGGHFIAYCCGPETGRWNKFNDAIVTEVKDFYNEVINYGVPYLLFYQKYF